MNDASHSTFRIAANVGAVLGTFFILAALIYVMYYYTRPGPMDEARWVERQRNLAELTAQNREVLGNYAYLDTARGLVRLPINRALELTVAEWQTPALGRSNLLARLERALPTSLTGQTNTVPTGTNPPAGVTRPK
jgi:hypothetical protein